MIWIVNLSAKSSENERNSAINFATTPALFLARINISIYHNIENFSQLLFD